MYQSSGREEESCCLLFLSSAKREIWHIHVVVVQRRQRNSQTTVLLTSWQSVWHILFTDPCRTFGALYWNLHSVVPVRMYVLSSRHTGSTLVSTIFEKRWYFWKILNFKFLDYPRTNSSNPFARFLWWRSCFSWIRPLKSFPTPFTKECISFINLFTHLCRNGTNRTLKLNSHVISMRLCVPLGKGSKSYVTIVMKHIKVRNL